MRSLLCGSLILGLAAHSLAATASAIDSLFQVDFTTNNKGGCNYIGQTTMQSILQDALDLIEIGTQIVTDYSNNVGPARRLLDSFFQVSTPPMTAAQLSDINTAYTNVASWIIKGGAINNGASTLKPYLFCYHNWLVKETMSSDALDSIGETYPNIYTGTPMLLNQEPDYVTKQQEETAALPGSSKAVPYWSPHHNTYIFDKSYGNINTGYCSVATSSGATSHALSPSTMTLCPRSFGTTTSAFTDANLQTAHYVARRTVAVNPVPKANVPTGNSNNFQKLSALTPTAVTLLHELFHLVLGNDATYSDVGEVYDLFTAKNVPQVVGLSYTDAVKNPESYALAAVAYDYTVNVAVDADGNFVEFYSGYTTQG